MSQVPPPIEPPPLPYTPGRKKKTVGIAMVVIITAAVLSVVALMVAILLPSLSEAKEKAKQVICQTKLKSIGYGISMYFEENSGCYPSNLENVIIYIDDDTEMFQCPSVDNHRKCDYFYSPPAEKITDVSIVNVPNTILACDFKDNHGGDGRNVLLADGHVQWLSEEEFQAALQQPYNTAFAKALREAEGQ